MRSTGTRTRTPQLDSQEIISLHSGGFSAITPPIDRGSSGVLPYWNPVSPQPTFTSFSPTSPRLV
ncbi:hypothetical protein EJ110_NYTH22131 [Nymphaea thermarum]|nr:hypothetical protein EJ110_NYTH22131 [Nymphaea thermarum]